MGPDSWPKSVTGTKETILSDTSTFKNPKELADPNSKFAHFRGVELHYKISKPFVSLSEFDEKVLGGEGTTMIGTPAILLHGFGASLFSFEKILRPLATLLGAPSLAFDRPGFGLTSRMKPPGNNGIWGFCPPESNPYSSTFSADATLGFETFLMQQISGQAKGTILVGHSAGAPVAVEAALEAPEKVSALILIAPALFSPLIPSETTGNLSEEPYFTEQREEAEKFKDALDKSKNRARGGKNPFKLAATLISAGLALIFGRIALTFLGAMNLLREGGRIVDDFVETAGRGVHLTLEDLGAGERVVGAMDNLGHVGWWGVKWVGAHLAMGVLWVGRNFKFVLDSLWGEICGLFHVVFAIGMRSKIGLWMIRQAISNGGVRAVKFAFHDRAACTQSTLDGYTKPMGCRDWDRGMAEFVIANGNTKKSVSNHLHELKCPVLVVTGDDDRIVPAWNSRRISSVIPRAEFRVIPNCGHLPHEEKPAEFLAICRDFILHNLVNADVGADVPVLAST